MTVRLLVFAGLVAMLSTGCAVRTGAYVGPVGPAAYYAGGPQYYGGGEVYVAPYAVPAWREPVVIGYPRAYYRPRAYVRVAPRYFAAPRHFAYRGGGRRHW